MSEEEKKPEPAEFPAELSAESLQLPRSYGILLRDNMRSSSKTTWPELVGVTGEEAEKKIKEEVPGVTVRIVPQGNFVTMDFNTNRVRIFVDPSGKVANTPKIG